MSKLRALPALLLLLLLAPICSAQQFVTPVAGVLTVDCTFYSSFKTVVTGNITSVVLTNAKGGQTVSILFQQDATGGHTVTFGGNVAGSPSVSTTANATTVITLQYDASANTWNAIGGGSVTLPTTLTAPGVFTISPACGASQTNCLQWKDDDTTDNCGAATTAFMALVNSYSGPGEPYLVIAGASANNGKAYLLASCHLEFDIPTIVSINATLDAGTNASTNLIQLGPAGLIAFSNAQLPPYRVQGGTFKGGGSLPIGIEVEPFVSSSFVEGSTFVNFGKASGAVGTCSGWAVKWDGDNNEIDVGDNWYWTFDSSVGRCAFDNAGVVGSNTAQFHDNHILGTSAPGFTSPCGTTAINEGGTYSNITNNSIYGFSYNITLFGTEQTVSHNALDTAGCTGSGVTNAPIQVFGAITKTLIDGNTLGGSSNSNLLNIASGSITDLAVTNNRTASAAALIPNGTACSGTCIASNNLGGTTGFGNSSVFTCEANSVSPAACGATVIGSFVVPASQTSYTVNTTAAKTFSRILIQQSTNNASFGGSPTCSSTAATPIVSAITNSTSFTVSLTSVAAQTCFFFTIINSGSGAS